MKRSKLKQELEVRLSVKYYQIVNKLADNLAKQIEQETEIQVIKGAPVETSGSLKRTLTYSGLVEDRDKKADRIIKMLKGMNTVEQLKSFLEK